MWRYDSKTDYIKAGRMRLADARELLEAPISGGSDEEQRLPHRSARHLRGALYLAGYAVECALKAYVPLARASTAETFSQAMEARVNDGETGLEHWREKAHNLRFLWRVAELESEVQDPDLDLKKELQVCLRWTPDWRYEPRPLTSRTEAGRVFGAVHKVYRWINDQRRLVELD